MWKFSDAGKTWKHIGLEKSGQISRHQGSENTGCHAVRRCKLEGTHKKLVVRKIHNVPADRFIQGEGYFGGQMLKEPVRTISAQISNGSE